MHNLETDSNSYAAQKASFSSHATLHLESVFHLLFVYNKLVSIAAASEESTHFPIVESA